MHPHAKFSSSPFVPSRLRGKVSNKNDKFLVSKFPIGVDVIHAGHFVFQLPLDGLAVHFHLHVGEVIGGLADGVAVLAFDHFGFEHLYMDGFLVVAERGKLVGAPFAFFVFQENVVAGEFQLGVDLNVIAIMFAERETDRQMRLRMPVPSFQTTTFTKPL